MLAENNSSSIQAIEADDENFNIDELEANLEAELESQLRDLSFLEEERAKIGNPDSLGKIIMDEVWTQFGNQIGLEMTNETLIQAYEREHPEAYSKEIGDAIMQDEKYKQANAAMKKQYEEGTLVDEYTGKMMGTDVKPNLDHVVPRKELYDNPRRKQAGIETAELANKDENLAATNESLNKSKKERSNQQYVAGREEREAKLKQQNEAAHKKIDASNMSEAEKRMEHEKADRRLQNKLDADDKRMLEADKKARQAINRDIAQGVATQTAKKAGKDALKMMAVSALFDLLKSIMNGLVRFFKEKQKSFRSFLSEMKASIQHFVSHISNFARTGASSFVGTVVSEIFGPIVSMFKKLASFIKQGASTITEAIHYLTDKNNKNKPLSIKIAQVGKITTTGLAAAGAIIGGELIEKALLQIPVMAVEIPLLGSIANITGMFLASLLSGIIAAIIMNRLDAFIAKRQKVNNLTSQMDKKNEILNVQHTLKVVKIEKLENARQEASQNIGKRHKFAAEQLEAVCQSVCDPAITEKQAANGERLSQLLQS